MAKDVNADPEFAKALWGLGAHYPNMQSGSDAEATGKPLWASEEDSTYNNAVGAGCWARVINQNYVRGNLTASINWNLISSYMKGTNWWRAGLMTAFQPWGGAYGSLAMIWASAHTTQFSEPYTWSYLHNGTGTGTGSGLLSQGGSYVTLENFQTGDFSIVVEKMSRDHSPCCAFHFNILSSSSSSPPYSFYSQLHKVTFLPPYFCSLVPPPHPPPPTHTSPFTGRPALAKFSVAAENATFVLGGSLAKATTLQLWRTHWSFGAPGDSTSEFISMPPITVVGGTFSLLLEPDSLYTITTLTTGKKGTFDTPMPPPALFPAVHVDNFQACAPSAEAPYFSDQNGNFECRPNPTDPARSVVMRQMVPLSPISWGGDTRPHTLIGSRDLVDTSMTLDVRLTGVNGSVILGARLAGTTNSQGLLVSLDEEGGWNITQSMATVQKGPAFASGTLSTPLGVDAWHTFRLDVNGTLASLWVDGSPVSGLTGLNVSQVTSLTGHNGVGTVQFGHYTEFTNFALYSTQLHCSTAPPSAGDAIKAVPCASEIGTRPGGQVVFNPSSQASCPYGSPCANANGTFALASNPSLCFAVKQGSASDDWPIALAQCDPTSKDQVFTQDYTMLYSTSIVHSASGRTVCLTSPDIGAGAYAHKQGGPAGNCGAFSYQGDEQEIVTINAYSVCLGTC